MVETPIDRFLLRNGYEASRALDDRREEGITKDYAFNRLSFDGGEIRNPADHGSIDVGVDGIQVKLVQGINEAAFRSTLSMATKATLGVDLSKPQDEGDWEEMLQGGLQTALETQVIVFAVSGVSRACTHQLVRSRRAAFHQQSMRAHYYGEQPDFRCPESVWAKGGRVLGVYLDAVAKCHEAYVAACEAGVSYQDARYILPEGTVNFILLEYPVREFLNVYAYRACSMFQWEIVQVMREAKRVLVAEHPWIEPYVKISCEKTHGAKDGALLQGYMPGVDPADLPLVAHTCTFQGWEQVEGQCDFPWARESNRTFRSERHEIKRKETV
jgi:flavin-dependent thymidylate synthase